MTKEQKADVLVELKDKLEEYDFFYLLDPTSMNAKETNNLRRKCFEQDIEIKVVKNTLAVTAMKDLPEGKNYAALFDAFHGQTALLFTKTANLPARMLKDIYDKEKKDKPKLKAAYVDTAVFIGEDQLDTLAKLKSKDELVGEILGLLQSPARNVISALQSGGQTIAGLVKTLEERGA
jgi:large subunit ribosomal protein L10